MINCISFKITPDQAKTLTMFKQPYNWGNTCTAMYLSVHHGILHWQLASSIGSIGDTEIVLKDYRKLNEALTLVSQGMSKQEIEECLNTTT